MICLINVNFIKDTSFHISKYGNIITTHDWTTWTSIFGDDGRFEIMRLLVKYIYQMRYII